MTGKVKGFEVKKNRNGTQNVLMLQCEISGPNDIQSVEYMSHAGDDHVPPIDSIVTILTAGPSWKIAIASNDTIDFDSSLDKGEKKIYSSDSGVEKAFIKWLKDGTIEINGNADNLVSFADLQTALNNFKTSLDTSIAGSITGHTHIYLPGPSPSVATAPGVGSAPGTSVDISASKVDTVKIP